MIAEVTQYLEICQKHAEEILGDGVSLNTYRSRKQKNIEVIKKQITIGKLGEFGVYEILKTSPPDLSITQNKSFEADLFLNEKRLHVKTCLEETRSWIFQAEDPLTFDPHPHDFVVFCFYKEHLDKIFIEIKQIIKATLLVELDLFSEPRVNRLKFIKKAVYLDDILRVTIY